MSRETKEDLELLRTFVRCYTLGSIASNTDYDSLLAQQHRRYLALLVFLAELDEQLGQPFGVGVPVPDFPSPLQASYIRESASDIGQAVFSWMHGGYKACRIILRSSIETFIKGIACADSPEVLTDTRVYKVFEFAANSPFFVTGRGKSFFSDLSARYSQLCSDVHTATAANMNRISALSYFPTFDEPSAKSASENIVFVTTRIISALCFRFNGAFHAMHHRNKEIILNCVPSGLKQHIQNTAT